MDNEHLGWFQKLEDACSRLEKRLKAVEDRLMPQAFDDGAWEQRERLRVAAEFAGLRGAPTKYVDTGDDTGYFANQKPEGSDA